MNGYTRIRGHAPEKKEDTQMRKNPVIKAFFADSDYCLAKKTMLYSLSNLILNGFDFSRPQGRMEDSVMKEGLDGKEWTWPGESQQGGSRKK